jgi:hypothetical protein
MKRLFTTALCLVLLHSRKYHASASAALWRMWR